MKTTIHLDDEKFKRLCELANTDHKSQAIGIAVDHFINNTNTSALVQLVRRGAYIDKDFDLKALRKLDA